MNAALINPFDPDSTAIQPPAVEQPATASLTPEGAVAEPFAAQLGATAAETAATDPGRAVAATTIQLTPSCDVVGDPSPMHDGGTWEQRRALTNGDSLVLEPTLTGRGACDSATLSHNKITQAVEIQSSCGGVETETAKTRRFSRDNRASTLLGYMAKPERPGPQDHIQDLEQLIGVAGKRRRRPLALPRFVPDKEAMWDAMHDQSAPRALETDPVWSDPPPLFLKG